MKLSRRIKPMHLRLVVEIADQQKLSLAAGRLAISQPSASRSLSEIEGLLGAELFVRHPKWMEPTEVGRVLIQHGRNILAEMDNLELEFDKALQGYAGQVRVGTVTGPACGFVIPALNKVRSRYPEIELTVEVAPSTALLAGLRAGTFDFVIGRLGVDDDVREFEADIGPPEVVVLCVGYHHPLAQLRDVELRTLTYYEWVMQEVGSPIRQAVEQAFIARHLRPPARVTNASSLLALLTFLAHSNAIIPLSEEVYGTLTSHALGANLWRLPIEESIVVPPAQIITNRSPPLSRAANKVFEVVSAELADFMPL